MKFSLFCVFFLLFALCNSQVQQELPIQSKLHSILTGYESISLGAVDHQAFLQQDAILKNQDGPHPLRYAKVQKVNLTLSNSGTWENVPSGRIWRLRIETKGAFFTQVLFQKYLIPPRASLHIYNDKKIIGAFTSENNKQDGVFATRPLERDSFTIEYYEPSEFKNMGEIIVEGVSHAYRNLMGTRDDSERCNINVMCPQGSDKKDQSRSVVALFARGEVFCTGAMINNNKKDGKQLMLTANHCGTASNSWIIIFNYESASCARGGRWSQEDTAAGLKSLSKTTVTDFQITEVLERLPNRYNVYLNGFNAIDEVAPSSFCVHHPSGAPKKVTITNRPTVHSSWKRRPEDPKTHWEVPVWQEGITEPGSSGSPIFNQKKQITGQLEGGKSECARMNGKDLYGKLSWSWSIGSSETNRLRDHLDPDNTKVKELDGMNLRTVDVPKNESKACFDFCNLKKSASCVLKCSVLVK